MVGFFKEPNSRYPLKTRINLNKNSCSYYNFIISQIGNPCNVIHLRYRTLYNLLNLFTGKIAMSNRKTRSQTVKDEVLKTEVMDHIIKQEIKTEVMDQVIKQEIKTEIEDVTGKSHGFICPTCKAHFLYDEYFIEHVREHHGDIYLVRR